MMVSVIAIQDLLRIVQYPNGRMEGGQIGVLGFPTHFQPPVAVEPSNVNVTIMAKAFPILEGLEGLVVFPD